MLWKIRVDPAPMSRWPAGIAAREKATMLGVSPSPNKMPAAPLSCGGVSRVGGPAQIGVDFSEAHLDDLAGEHAMRLGMDRLGRFRDRRLRQAEPLCRRLRCRDTGQGIRLSDPMPMETPVSSCTTPQGVSVECSRTETRRALTMVTWAVNATHPANTRPKAVGIGTSTGMMAPTTQAS